MNALVIEKCVRKLHFFKLLSIVLVMRCQVIQCSVYSFVVVTFQIV